jgi:hypothetical protein
MQMKKRQHLAGVCWVLLMHDVQFIFLDEVDSTRSEAQRETERQRWS